MKLSDFWVQGCLDALEKFAAIAPNQMQALEKQYGHLPADEFNNLLRQELARTATHTDPRLAQGVEQGAALASKPKAPSQNFAYNAQQAASWGPDTFWKKMQFAPNTAAPVDMGGAPPVKGQATSVARLGARR